VKCIKLLLILSFIGIHHSSTCQTPGLAVNEWAKKLADPGDKENKLFFKLDSLCIQLDSTAAFSFLTQLSKNPDAKGNYFLSRYFCLQASFVVYFNKTSPEFAPFKKKQIKQEVKNLLSNAMQLAYETNDDYLTAMVSGIYGNYMYILEETDLAVMYMMNSAELYDKINLPAQFGNYVALGEILWRVREYEKSIKYTEKAINVLNTSNTELKDSYTMTCNNTIALAYHRMVQYDSAFLYYGKALETEQKINSPVWKGIISGNMAQIYFAQGNYTAALPLFDMDYKNSKENEIYDNAANSLQWAAKTNLALGNRAIALIQVREAFGLLQKWPSPNYMQNAYNTASEIFKSLGHNDSAYYYAGKYNKLHDSLERTIYQSSISISKLRLNEEKNRYGIGRLQREKEEQAQQRNFIIAGILFLAVIALLLINRQRLKVKYQQELTRQENLIIQQENLRIQQEMESATVQLKMFTENIIEKTNLVEKLEQQLNNKTLSREEQQLISELSQQTILTEDDWDKFKSLFEKIFPMFFQRLKNTVADITVAEQRMAALTRLQLTTRQMASMLGISVDSVHKTKQRLRKRFNLGTDANMEEYIAGI
jgi:tetratricopeptide (TPR) repeat protein/DNA-binding CsgD family transcriptional regulator